MTTERIIPAVAAPARRSPVLRFVVGAVAVVLLAVGFTFATGAQGRHEVTVVAPADRVAAAAAAVPWSLYRTGFREELAADSCEQLNTAYGAAQLVDGPVDSHPVEAYILAIVATKHCTYWRNTP